MISVMTWLTLHCMWLVRTPSAAAVEIVDATTENERASEADINFRHPITDVGLALLHDFTRDCPKRHSCPLSVNCPFSSACLNVVENLLI